MWRGDPVKTMVKRAMTIKTKAADERAVQPHLPPVFFMSAQLLLSWSK
jgi:hypothetical protein